MRKLSSDECDRLWQHALHEDALFNERLNSFVTFQSVLLALAALLVSESDNRGDGLICALIVAGMATSVVSAYVQLKQVHLIGTLTERCRAALPEFAETLETLEASRWRRVSSKKLLAVLLPAIFALTWITFWFA